MNLMNLMNLFLLPSCGAFGKSLSQPSRKTFMRFIRFINRNAPGERRRNECDPDWHRRLHALTKTWEKSHLLRLADIDSKIKSKVHESETPFRAAQANWQSNCVQRESERRKFQITCGGSGRGTIGAFIGGNFYFLGSKAPIHLCTGLKLLVTL